MFKNWGRSFVRLLCDLKNVNPFRLEIQHHPRVQQMLMHRKTCLIPIFMFHCFTSNNSHCMKCKLMPVTGAIRKLLYDLCVCTGDNTFAKAHGLSSHTMGDPEWGKTGGPDPPPPLKNHKNIGFPSNIDLDPLKITRLPSQHSIVGHYRHASEMPF